MSYQYQRDQGLFDSFKAPHQVVAVVNVTAYASSFINKCLFFYNHRGSALWNEPTPQQEMYTIIHSQPAKDNITTVYFSTVLWRDVEIIVRDMHVTWTYESFCTRSFTKQANGWYIVLQIDYSSKWFYYCQDFLW